MPRAMPARSIRPAHLADPSAKPGCTGAPPASVASRSLQRIVHKGRRHGLHAYPPVSSGVDEATRSFERTAATRAARRRPRPRAQSFRDPRQPRAARGPEPKRPMRPSGRAAVRHRPTRPSRPRGLPRSRSPRWSVLAGPFRSSRFPAHGVSTRTGPSAGATAAAADAAASTPYLALERDDRGGGVQTQEGVRLPRS